MSINPISDETLNQSIVPCTGDRWINHVIFITSIAPMIRVAGDEIRVNFLL